MTIYTQALEPERYYHIYNHAVGRDNLFRTNENYHYFLKKYIEHIYPIADTFAYCLMPNHFHLAVRIKSISELATLAKLERGELENQGLSNFLSKQFSNLFSS